jgi:TRAP-type C4-dicarboxylate transport system permease large subunit
MPIPIRLSDLMVGYVRAELAQVIVSVCTLFGEVAGTVFSETSWLVSVLIPSMVKDSYKRKLSAALATMAYYDEALM